MKKIAFPTEDGETISRHLGQAPFFLIATLDDAGNVAYEKREKPHHGSDSGSHQHEHSGHGMGQIGRPRCKAWK